MNNRLRLVLLTSAMALTSCANNGDNSTGVVSIKEGIIPTFTTQRNLTEYQKADFTGMSEFITNSIKGVDRIHNKANYAFSPVSYYDSLGLLSQLSEYDGEKLYSDLGHESNEKLLSTLKNLRKGLNFDQSKENSLYRARLASALSVLKSSKIELSKEVKDIIQDLELGLLFHGDSKEEEKQVKWLKEATFDLYNSNEPVISGNDDTLLGFISTLSYSYTYAFSKNTVEFNGKSVEGFIEETSSLYYSDEVLRAVSISLKNEKLVFFVPNEGKTFDLSSISSTLEKMKESFVRISAPYFDIDNQLDLNEVTKTDLGIDYIYTKSALSKVSSSASAVSKIEQKTTFSLSSNGIQASSTTAIKVPVAPGEVEYIDVNVDKPFYFSLIDSAGLPLFVGHVSNI